MLDFEALDKAFALITDVGRGEATLEVDDHQVTLRVLLPEEDAAVLRTSSQFLKEADGANKVDQPDTMAYLNRFQVEVLSHAVVQIDDLDLRAVDFVATGQQTESGKAVRVPRHVAVRDLITKKRPWSTVMRSLAYNCYSGLLDKTNEQAENLVEWDPSDLQAEIDRVEGRLNTLKATLERRTKGDPNLMQEQVEAVRQYDEASRRAARKAPQAKASPEQSSSPAAPAEVAEPPLPEAAEPPPSEPAWAEFNDMPTESDLQDTPQEPEPPPQEPVPSLRTEPRQPIIPPSSVPPKGASTAPPHPPAPPHDPMPDVMDSFQEPGDEGALAAEQARLIAARRQMLLEQQQAARAGEASAVHRPRAVTPPHLRGREDVPVGPSIDATPVQGPGGIQAYRLPTQELSGRGRGRQPGEPAPAPKARNPNFKPAGGG